MSLGVPARNVHFKRVETRRSGKRTWTYSDIEVRLTKRKSHKKIRAAFSNTLSQVVPKPVVRFSLGLHKETVVHIRLKNVDTHRITVFPDVTQARVLREREDRKAKVAIIIDDMGYDSRVAKKFLALQGNLSFSILPHSPNQRQIAAAVHQQGRDVLLHLPMEPIEYPGVDPGKGALLESMQPDELIQQLKRNLDAVPFVVGVNNHMGSKLTQSSAKMRQIFTVLKRRDLFFVDSLTSSRSRCMETANLLQLKFARRQVFLDHVQENMAIRLQIKRLISIAKNHGQAIGIAHPYPATLDVLQEELDNIENEVDLVSVSTLVR